MNYYTVAKIGTGTSDDPYRPNVPIGTAYVCEETNDGSFLVCTNALLNQTLITDLQGACSYYGLDHNDVITWSVG